MGPRPQQWTHQVRANCRRWPQERQSVVPAGPVTHRRTNMTEKIFVERRPEGDYAVRRPNSQRGSGVTSTQAEAIELARRVNPGGPVLVERVRTTPNGKPDKWRKP